MFSWLLFIAPYGPSRSMIKACVSSLLLPWWGSPVSAASRCGSGRCSPVSRCSPAGRPAWTPHPGSAGAAESARTSGSRSPWAPPGAVRTPGIVRLGIDRKLRETERERGKEREFVLGVDPVIPQLCESPQIKYHLLSITPVSLDRVSVLIRSRWWFSLRL